jgi:hypothetical protein
MHFAGRHDEPAVERDDPAAPFAAFGGKLVHRSLDDRFALYGYGWTSIGTHTTTAEIHYVDRIGDPFSPASRASVWLWNRPFDIEPGGCHVRRGLESHLSNVLINDDRYRDATETMGPDEITDSLDQAQWASCDVQLDDQLVEGQTTQYDEFALMQFLDERVLVSVIGSWDFIRGPYLTATKPIAPDYLMPK